MKLEDQVVSLELSRKLQELGVEVGSFFNWNVDKREGERRLIETWMFEGMTEIPHKYIPAYTASELMEMLPAEVIHSKDSGFLCVQKHNYEGSDKIEYVCEYECHDTESCFNVKFQEDSNLANALALMYIYLIEHNLIEL